MPEQGRETSEYQVTKATTRQGTLAIIAGAILAAEPTIRTLLATPEVAQGLGERLGSWASILGAVVMIAGMVVSGAAQAIYTKSRTALKGGMVLLLLAATLTLAGCAGGNVSLRLDGEAYADQPDEVPVPTTLRLLPPADKTAPKSPAASGRDCSEWGGELRLLPVTPEGDML